MCYKKFDEEFMLNEHIVATHPVKIRLDNKPAKRGRGRPPKEAVHKSDHGLPSVHCHLCVATFKNYYFLKQHLDKEHVRNIFALFFQFFRETTLKIIFFF